MLRTLPIPLQNQQVLLIMDHLSIPRKYVLFKKMEIIKLYTISFKCFLALPGYTLWIFKNPRN